MNWIINLSATILVCGTLVTATSSATAAQPSVRLPEYFAHGFYNTTAKNNKATLYLGLPFAQPPKGILRFEKTVPLFPDLLFRKHVSATKWPKACHQVINATSMGIFSDEDCLYLNVMAPPNKSATLLPVFVFIHGGGYEYGLTEEYGWEYFVDNFITQNVIMVTLQYRLAHFGFFATEDGVINGNFGHFDQVEALKFIKRNIKAFGGDPNRITLSGHSAGSSAVHSVSLSPKSRGLFNQELRISGSDYAQWAINNRVVYKQSKMVSDAVGCTQANTHLRKICLKTKHYGDFWNARNTLNLTDFPLDNLDIIYWTSVFDNDFFEGKNLSTLQKEAPKRPTLYGIDAGEGMLWSFYGENPITNVFSFGGRGFTTENRTLCTPQFIHDFLHQQLFYYSSFTEQQKTEIIDRIFEHYKIGEEYGTDNPLYHWYKLTDLYSDFVYKVPHSQEVEYKLENGFDNQYFYVWNYTRPQDRPLIGDLPGHGYFLMYFAGLVIYTNNGLSHSPADIKAQEHLQDLFVSFIKTGVPVSGGVAAEKITASRIPYLEIRENVLIDDVTFKPKQIFWDQLNADYNYNFFKGVPLGQNA